ncbi:TonB-dependent receptor [Pseudomonas putida]|nr:TonB-dependent receptor [Pseudomonas putida]
MTTPRQQTLRPFGRLALASSLVLGTCAMPMGIGMAHAAPATNAASRQMIQFDIPAQALDSAVLAYAEQSGVQVFFDSRKLAGLNSAGLHGAHAAEDGLRQLLQGTPVRYRFSAAGQVGLERVEADGQALELGTTHVESTRDGDWVYMTPRSVSVVTRKQIDQRPPRHAADMLEQTAGVYTAVNQRDPGLSVNIRGVQDYGRVNMNIDGMRQNFSVNGHQQRNGVMFIDPEFVQNVEIDKGTSAGMGGAGVIGGIASFATIDARDLLAPGKEIGGRLRAGHGIGELGNGTYFNGSALFAVGNEVGDILVGHSERHFGDYRSGTQNAGNLGTQMRGKLEDRQAWKSWLNGEVGGMDSVTRSQIFKLGLNLPDEQRLQFSYFETDTDSKDAWTVKDSGSHDYYYRVTGTNDINARNAALDYSFNPNELIDFKAKLYYVTTRQDRWNANNASSENSGNRVEDYTDRYQTDTWGLQLQNTSRWHLFQADSLTFNYGSEAFQDTFRPSTNRIAAVNETESLPYVQGANPKGKRVMASLFGNLSYEHDDWLVVDAGLRYDRYRLTGKTGVTTWMYPEGVTETNLRRQRTDLLFEEDREEGRFSPTFGIAVKPGLEWLQVYTRWGRGWRPPAVTEAYMSGRPHGGGNEMVYPNPFLKAEESHNWELGLNIFKESLLRSGDRFAAKIAYFDTRIDNFSFLDTNASLPGSSVSGIALGRSVYQNNLETTQFRGVEYSLDYDAGDYYGQLSYTHMIGSNDFCSNQFYLGGAQQLVSAGTVLRPVQVGSRIIMLPVRVSRAEANATENNRVSCGDIMGNASYMPADRGSLTLGMRFLDKTLDVGMRLRYSEGNGKNLDTHGYSQIDQAMWPKYKVYDLYASYWMTPSLNLALSLENATDEAYFVAMGDVNNLSLARGRTLSGMLEYRF